jgi:CHAT domain-containing protein
VKAVADWNVAIDLVLGKVGDLLMKPISRELSRLGLMEGAEVVIVASGVLGLLPLHAAPVDSNRRFLDLWAVAYAPDAAAIARRGSAERTEGRTAASLLAVTNPNGDLRIRRNPAMSEFLPDRAVDLKGGAALLESVIEEMQRRDYISFYCHGTWDSVDPEESGLEMACGERLTVATLRSLKLDMCRLIVLGACESGVNEIRLVPDEFIGLPATLIAAGATCVVASLWIVEAEATASLVWRLFNLHLEFGHSPASALRIAQLELRDGLLPLSPGDLGRESSNDEPTTRFCSPSSTKKSEAYYWAAFACYGG